VTTWDPDQYLRFALERERPFDELVARVRTDEPRLVADLGCGPGTATVRLLDRWRQARVLGVDSSEAMIAEARQRSRPGRLDFAVGDVRDWQPAEALDVIVSNALLQWVPGHAELLASWAGWLAPGGTLAFQVPANFEEPIHKVLRALATSGRWSIPADGLRRDRPVLEPAGYLARLLGLGLDADVWETTYLQVLTGPDAVLSWARGTALRPVLSTLDPSEVASFEEAYGAALREAYPRDGSGRTVLPFRRIFAVGRRPT
jgi:trans-aconitate 2-methyltransferase